MTALSRSSGPARLAQSDSTRLFSAATPADDSSYMEDRFSSRVSCRCAAALVRRSVSSACRTFVHMPAYTCRNSGIGSPGQSYAAFVSNIPHLSACPVNADRVQRCCSQQQMLAMVNEPFHPPNMLCKQNVPSPHLCMAETSLKSTGS